MKGIQINRDYCKGCGLCIGFCPRHCLVLSEDINEYGYRTASLKSDANCTGCGICKTMCPDIVIEITEIMEGSGS
jgi:2-oxoglutarate ferredoxin oxidoreductase subunit delta